MTQGILFPPKAEWSAPTSFPDLTSQKEIAIDLETCDPWLMSHGPGWAFKNRGHIIGIAVAAEGWRGYFPIAHETGGNLDEEVVRRWLQRQLDAPNAKIFHNAQYDVGWLNASGYVINGTIHDTMMAAPLINENEYSYSLNNVGKTYLNEEKDERLLIEAADAFGVNPKSEMYKLAPEYVGMYAEQDADLTYRLWQVLKKGIAEEDVGDIYKLETSLIPVLIDMRRLGVRIDVDRAQQVKRQLQKEESKVLKEVKRWYGIEPDLWAAQSLAQVFDRAGLDYPKTPKTNAPSFVANWLEEQDHRLPMAIHGELHPLRSDNGGTVTGRFSCSNPNLQQVPARDPMIGQLIRSLFIPEEGSNWGCFDYSQQEPRLTVHYSVLTQQEGAEEAALEYAFDDADFHQIVADMANISRKEAKIINLGLSYGMGKDKLTTQLGISLEEAESLFDQYHQRVPFIRGLRDSASRMGSNRGYVKTLLGRKCRFNLYEPFDRRETPLPIEKAMDEYGGRLKRAYTYKAMNRLIQGSAADMTKQAMLDLHKEGFTAHTQVHDELNISVINKKDCERVIEIMRDCVELKVPNKVDAEIGTSWGDVKHYEEYFNVKK